MLLNSLKSLILVLTINIVTTGCQIKVKPNDVKVKGEIRHIVQLDNNFENYFREQCKKELAVGATQEQIDSCINEKIAVLLNL